MNEHHELYENARIRVQQKKRLYFHFVLFLVGSIFLVILDKIFKLDEILFENWFIWAIVLWLFFWVLHFINVFVTNRFMGKDWERKQIDKLVLKQELKIAKLEKEIAYKTKLKAEDVQSDATALKKKQTPLDNQAKE